jgi:hypothetical protein
MENHASFIGEAVVRADIVEMVGVISWCYDHVGERVHDSVETNLFRKTPPAFSHGFCERWERFIIYESRGLVICDRAGETALLDRTERGLSCWSGDESVFSRSDRNGNTTLLA